MAIGVLPKLQDTAKQHHTTPTLSLVGSMVHIFAPEAQLEPIEQARDTFEALSNPKTAQMEPRYPLSKLMEHLCFLQLVARLPDPPTPTHVAINIINPGWCKTELSRYQQEPFWMKFMAMIFRRTSEEGSRTLVHGVTAGAASHGKYLSECQEKDMSAWVRSDVGVECRKRLFQELAVRLERISPGVTKCLNPVG